MDRRIPEESGVKSDSEIFKGRALAAFAHAEKATAEETRAEFLEVAVQWLKLATEAANLQEKASTSKPD